MTCISKQRTSQVTKMLGHFFVMVHGSWQKLCFRAKWYFYLANTGFVALWSQTVAKVLAGAEKRQVFASCSACAVYVFSLDFTKRDTWTRSRIDAVEKGLWLQEKPWYAEQNRGCISFGYRPCIPMTHPHRWPASFASWRVSSQDCLNPRW